MAHFDQLVLSGGGLRCFWQGGWLDVVRDVLPLEPRRVTGVSGGSVTAAGFLARRGRDLLDRMCDAFEELDANLQIDDLDEEDGRTPHQRTFEEVLSGVFDAGALEQIAGGPKFQVQIAHPPTQGVAGLSGTAMTIAYEAELHIVNAPHFNWAEKFGLTSELVDANQAARDRELVHLLLAAVTIPPVFRTRDWNGKPVVDGGMADQAPLPMPDEGRTLILLTREYRNIPDVADRLYVMPSGEVPSDKLDFTDPDKLRRTWDQGRADGEAFLEKFDGA